MKKVCIAAIALMVFLSCNTSKDVVLSMTNPQDLTVPFTGYYYFEAVPEDTTMLNGTTPREYSFVIEKGDVVKGIVHKDGPNMVDTLHFRVLLDGDETVTQKTTSPAQVVQFTISGE